MVVDVVQNPQKSNEYECEKKHLRRDSKMCCCCCCCRFCCGAPTTDERIHTPVLHDASQIAYCRYWGRVSLPPITIIRRSFVCLIGSLQTQRGLGTHRERHQQQVNRWLPLVSFDPFLWGGISFFKVCGDIQPFPHGFSRRHFSFSFLEIVPSHRPTTPTHHNQTRAKHHNNTTHYTPLHWDTEYFALPAVQNISQYTQYGKIHCYLLVRTLSVGHNIVVLRNTI